MVIMTPNHQYHKKVLFYEFREKKWSRKGQTQNSSNSNMFTFDQDKCGRYWMWEKLLQLRSKAHEEMKVILKNLRYDSPDKDKESKQICEFDNLRKTYSNFNNLEVGIDTQFLFEDKTLHFSPAKTNRSSLFDCILRLEGKVSLDYPEVLKKSIKIISTGNARPGLTKNDEKNIPLEDGMWYRYQHTKGIIKGMYSKTKGAITNVTLTLKSTNYVKNLNKSFKDLNKMISEMHNDTDRTGKSFTCRDVIEILVGKDEDIWIKYGEYLRKKGIR
jgi:hypothetical protein